MADAIKVFTDNTKHIPGIGIEYVLTLVESARLKCYFKVPAIAGTICRPGMSE
jgi:hypothetical protein